MRIKRGTIKGNFRDITVFFSKGSSEVYYYDKRDDEARKTLFSRIREIEKLGDGERLTQAQIDEALDLAKDNLSIKRRALLAGVRLVLLKPEQFAGQTLGRIGQRILAGSFDDVL